MALAGCGHPRRGTINTRMENPARNERHATQHDSKKQSEEPRRIADLRFKISD
jgi:hypothetical protein